MWLIWTIGYVFWGVVWGYTTKKVIENKGYSENWFWWGFFFGVIALIVAISKPDLRQNYIQQEQLERIIDSKIGKTTTDTDTANNHDMNRNVSSDQAFLHDFFDLPVNLSPALKRTYIFLEDGDFLKADKYAENVLDEDPENAYAYLAKLLIRLKLRTRASLAEVSEDYRGYPEYLRTLKYVRRIF